MLLLPDGQTGEACEPSKKQRCWRNRRALVRTEYQRASVSLEWKQCLLTYRLQTRAGPVSLTYQKRVPFSQTLHPACGPSYSTTTSLTLLFSNNHSDKPCSDRWNITFVVTKLQTRLSHDYKWHTLPDALGPTRDCKWSSDFVFFLFYSLIYVLLGPDLSMALWDHAETAACLIIYICNTWTQCKVRTSRLIVCSPCWIHQFPWWHCPRCSHIAQKWPGNHQLKPHTDTACLTFVLSFHGQFPCLPQFWLQPSVLRSTTLPNCEFLPAANKNPALL